MGEYIPIFDSKGNVTRFIVLGSDILLVYDKNGENYYLCLDGTRCFKINDYIRNETLVVNDHKISLRIILDTSPTLHGYVAYDFDEYIRYLSKLVKDSIVDKKIVLSYSGGKDSTAALITLIELQNYIPFKIYPIYVHMPFLESPENLNYISEIGDKLGVEIKVLEADREYMRQKLLTFGMPIRGYRWCTYQKIKAYRKIKKRIKADLEVIGDRISETYKRFKTLIQYAIQRKFIIGKQFKPTFLFTILDVIKIVRDYKLIHPDYLEGNWRVSCSLCPYRIAPEIKIKSLDIEDPEFISKVLYETYNKHYNAMLSFKDFVELSIWRYAPERAKILLKIRENMLKQSSIEYIEFRTINDWLKSIWVNKLPSNPVFTVDEAIEIWKTTNEKGLNALLNPPKNLLSPN